MSSFVVVSDGPRILVGKMAEPETWVERFFVGPKFAPTYAKSDKFLLPARHLAWYESPLEAAEGIMRDQLLLRVPTNKIALVGVQSHIRGDKESKDEPPHWDICFVYETKLSGAQARSLTSPAWFKDFGFRARSSLSPDDFTRGHGDVLEEAGMIHKTKRHAAV